MKIHFKILKSIVYVYIKASIRKVSTERGQSEKGVKFRKFLSEIRGTKSVSWTSMVYICI